MNCASCWRGCAACCAACRRQTSRRSRQATQPDGPARRVVSFGAFSADLDGRMVTGAGGAVLDLAKSEFDVLEVFLTRANRLLTPRRDLRGDRLRRGSGILARGRHPHHAAAQEDRGRSGQSEIPAHGARRRLYLLAPERRSLSGRTATVTAHDRNRCLRASTRHRRARRYRSPTRADRAPAARGVRLAAGDRRRRSRRWPARSAAHRAILFRLRELPGQGFAQSIAAYWVDDEHRRHRRRRRPPSSSRSSTPIRCSSGWPRKCARARCLPDCTRDIDGFLRARFREAEDQVVPVGLGLRARPSVGHARDQRLRRRARLDRRREGRRRDRRAGDRRRDRALAVRRPCQRDHPPDHAAGVARRHHRHRRDRQHHRVQPGRRAHVRLQAQRHPRQGPARHGRPAFLPQGLCHRRRIHGRARRADDRPAHGDGHPERRRRDLSDRTDGDRDEGRRPAAVLRLDPRSARASSAPRRRSTASARSCTRTRRWRRWARCWPASRTNSTTRSPSSSRSRRCCTNSRPIRRPSCAPRRCAPPPSAAAASSRASSAWCGCTRPCQTETDLNDADPRGARGHRLWRALERHQHRHRSSPPGRCRCWPMPTTSPRSPPISWSTASTRWPPPTASAASRCGPSALERRQCRLLGRGQRPGHPDGDPPPHLRILFHHQAGRRRHRHRPVDLEVDRRAPQGHGSGSRRCSRTARASSSNCRPSPAPRTGAAGAGQRARAACATR